MPPVMLYALSTCIHCRKAKEFLENCHVPYKYTYVDQLAGEERTDTVTALKKLNPALSFPTLVIGDRVVVGFNEEDIRNALGI